MRFYLIDGEVVCSEVRGLARFDVLRRHDNEATAFLCAFDLLDGTELRRGPTETRKATLARIQRKSRRDVRRNDHLEHPEGLIIFQHACR